MDVWLVVLGAALLALDSGLVLVLARRVPPARMSLYTLPLFIAGFALVFAGVM